jgi:hypothetical protein
LGPIPHLAHFPFSSSLLFLSCTCPVFPFHFPLVGPIPLFLRHNPMAILPRAIADPHRPNSPLCSLARPTALVALTQLSTHHGPNLGSAFGFNPTTQPGVTRPYPKPTPSRSAMPLLIMPHRLGLDHLRLHAILHLETPPPSSSFPSLTRLTWSRVKISPKKNISQIVSWFMTTI